MTRHETTAVITGLLLILIIFLTAQDALAIAGFSARLLPPVDPGWRQACELPVPLLVSPAEDASTGLAPLFKFRAAEGVKRYSIWISVEADMSPWLYASNHTYVIAPAAGTMISFDLLDENLQANSTYYWRMASRCDDNAIGSYTPTYAFTTNAAVSPPPVPVVTFPADEASTGSTRVHWIFGPVAGVTTYQIRLYNSMEDPFYSSSFASSSPIVSHDLEPERIYYWRAISRNVHSWSPLAPLKVLMTPALSASVTLQPGVAGQLTPGPGNISLSFSSGSVTETTQISYTLQVEPNQDLAGFGFGGRAFSIQASNSQGQPVDTFGQSFTMTVEYGDADLLAAGLFPSELSLYYWDGSNWQNLLPCPGCSLDTSSRRITVILDHLTDFALLGDTTGRRFVYLPLVNKPLAD